MSERADEHLLGALKRALAEPGDHRLYKGGKLAGLFASRHGPAGDAAAAAIRDGLFEVVRTDVKGKITTEWVRLTPTGVDYLHDHESPLAVLRELRSALGGARDGVPVFLGQMQQQWQAFSAQMIEQMRAMLKRLEVLSERVEEALRRADAIGPKLPDGVAETVPWAVEALGYLDRRKNSGAVDGCPLPELFAAVRRATPELSLGDFQTGLRRLGDHRALTLLPFEGSAEKLPEPEFALLDGACVLYYAAR
jgi:hypothetical protein